MNVPILRQRPGDAFVPAEQARAHVGVLPDLPSADKTALHPFQDSKTVSEEHLLLQTGLPYSRLHRIRTLAAHWGVDMREAALAMGAVRHQDYARALALAHGLTPRQVRDTITLRCLAPAPEPYRLLEGGKPAPLETPRGGVAVNADGLSPVALSALIRSLGPASHRLAIVPRSVMSVALAKTYGPQLAYRASEGLRERNPRFSAATGFIKWQIVALSIATGLFLGAAIFTPREALALYCALLSIIFFITISLRAAAAAHAGYRRFFARRTPYRRLRDHELPRYTILVAMFKEARVLPELVAGLRAIDYPPAKLDIKLVLEEVDDETIAAARDLKLPPHFEIVTVPDGKPRTKPRALNYALQFARGEYLVIYDAEDRPDPNQLRKAAAHFREASPKVACLQGKLIFDNASENWLSKQFTIEYASLFAGILPLLDKARLPLPLGGTSNHFQTRVLRNLGGWDAHNVTEDADLGMRIYRAGLRAEVLDSVTYEEAACQMGNWIRQRTRWLKGWMQTYFVHMRQPWRLLRELGLPGFLAFQGHFAGIIIAALVHPWSYVIIVHDAAFGLLLSQPQSLLGWNLMALAMFNLIAGYAASIALGFFVLSGRNVKSLVPQLAFIPFYWLLVSAAAYRALYQLVTAPHYWEKTEHGVTNMRRGQGVKSNEGNQA